MTCLSFSGVGGSIGFQVGAAQALYDILPNTPTTFAGISSGSVIATLLALNHHPTRHTELFSRFTALFTRWYHHPFTHWFSHLREFWREVMPATAYQQVSGKLFIGYSALTSHGLESRVVSKFISNDDLIAAIEASCHIMPLRLLPIGMYRGEIVCDGIFTQRLVRPPGVKVVGITGGMVCHYASWSDWVPSLCLVKAERLALVGEAFVHRHKDYFLALATKEDRLGLQPPRLVAYGPKQLLGQFVKLLVFWYIVRSLYRVLRHVSVTPRLQ